MPGVCPPPWRGRRVWWPPNALDGEAMRLVGTSLARLDMAGARAASGRLVKPGAAATLKGLGTDVATLGQNAGYRTTVAALGTAKSAEELGVLARLSSRFGKATRGVMVLGGAAFTAASLLGTADGLDAVRPALGTGPRLCR